LADGFRRHCLISESDLPDTADLPAYDERVSGVG
jgi:hypothetical protein